MSECLHLHEKWVVGFCHGCAGTHQVCVDCRRLLDPVNEDCVLFDGARR